MLRRQQPASRSTRVVPCPSDTRCTAAASLQEFLVRSGDTKKTAGADGGGLLGCAKVCDNVSAVHPNLQLHALSQPQRLRLVLKCVGWQVLSAVSNAALDDAFASAVLGKKVSEGCGIAIFAALAHDMPRLYFRRAPSTRKYVQSCSPSRRSSSSRNPMMLCCPCLRPSPNIPSSPSPASSNRLQQQRPLCPCCPPPPSPLSCTLWRGGLAGSVCPSSGRNEAQGSRDLRGCWTQVSF